MGGCVGKHDDNLPEEQGQKEKPALPDDLRTLLVKQQLPAHELEALTTEQLYTKQEMIKVWERRQAEERTEAEHRRRMEQNSSNQSQDGGLTPRSRQESDALVARAKLHENLADVFVAADYDKTEFLNSNQLGVATDAVLLAMESEPLVVANWEGCWCQWATALKKNFKKCDINVSATLVHTRLTALAMQAGPTQPISMEEFIDAIIAEPPATN